MAGILMKDDGFGLFGNIVIGIIKLVVGGFVFGQQGISAGNVIDSTVTATVGAIVLLFVVSLIKKA